MGQTLNLGMSLNLAWIFFTFVPKRQLSDPNDLMDSLRPQEAERGCTFICNARKELLGGGDTATVLIVSQARRY